MDETLLYPSPNWFQSSGMAVSPDDWVIYGGPSKSLCVLEPLSEEYNPVVHGHQGYTAHVVNRAHPEKIVCVDICPEWPEKRAVLTGSADGTVKQWSLEHSQRTLKITSTHSHEIHSHEKEEVVGVGYCNNGYAVTVGSYGTIVKWDVNSNVAKSFNHVLKNFKPVCMACSPHIHMNVAIGTKQGVLFVLDLNGAPRIIYKVRGQDDEILKVSWCPQYEVAIQKALKESDKKSTATNRMEKIRNETEPPEVMKTLDERVKNSFTTEKPVQINEKSEPVETKNNALEESGIGKTLPEDSFDDSVVPEDDMFDIYKDHEADEFGHKKYQPEDILVKVAEETPKEDYLAECLKLKEEILKRKVEAEASVTDLVEALDKASVEDKVEASISDTKQPEKEEVKPVETLPKPAPPVEGKITKGEVESSVHIHKHLLATIGKHGSIRVWSKSGKLVGSCAVPSSGGGGGGRHNQRQRGATASTLLWHQPDILLIADGKSQLLECNPLRIDCKNKLEWRVLHSGHKRGLFAVSSGAPRVQTPGMTQGDWPVWSAAQDRLLISYSLKSGRAVTRSTCGGFVYTLSVCPYDARKIAMSVGDGAVRVWETDTTDGDENKLLAGKVTSYWHNVQGKVLSHAWHPSREDLLAFGTAESRVGLINTAGGIEKPARVLLPALSGGVYSLYWGAGLTLYACGNGELVAYSADTPDDAPTPIPVEFEGQKWEVSVGRWYERGLLVGSVGGAVAVLTPEAPHRLLAATIVYSKMIHTISWHPQETSASSEVSPRRDLIAVCSLDKANTVLILEYQQKEDGTSQLPRWKSLSGHTAAVLQVMWSVHRDHQLLSTSADCTVRIWDIEAGVCTSIFGGHTQSALGATWSAHPQLADTVISGGADCAVRLWDITTHTPDLYYKNKQETTVDKKKKNRKEKKEAKEKKERGEDECSLERDETAAAVDDGKTKWSKKFLLPLTYKQTHPCTDKGPRRMLQKYLERVGADVAPTGSGSGSGGGSGEEYGLDYIKLFGNINEVNEVLDAEMERHQDTGNCAAWSLVCVVRGDIDTCIQHAAATNTLDPFLLSIAPAISFKYWKDATMLYLQQIERLVAKGEESKLNESLYYGGAVYRRAAVQLSLHDVKEAVNTLRDARLFPEAYVLSRTRYMDSLAQQTLQLWAQDCLVHGTYNMAAVCLIALEDLSGAAAALGRCSGEGSLSVAADIATVLGQNTFAGHIQLKRELIMNQKESAKEEKEEIKKLPSRSELELKAKGDASDVEVIISEEKEQNIKLNVPSDEAKVDISPEPVEIVTEKVEGKLDEIVKDTKDRTAEMESAIKDLNNKDEPKIEETDLLNTKAQDDIKVDGAIEDDPKTEGPDLVIKSTEELMKELPAKMEGLLKDANENTMHKGDGDTIQNNTVNVDTVAEKDVKENDAALVE